MSELEHLKLADGRQLDIRVSGSEAGVPLIFHHGTVGAAPPLRGLERATHQRGLRLVTYSRAGYGGSSRNAGRRVVDVVGDMEEVLRAVGAERCLVAGLSGGGPHALACAARLPSAAAVLVIAGVAPYGGEGLDWLAGMGDYNIAEFRAALEGEGAFRSFVDQDAQQLKDATAADIISTFDTLLPEVDKAVLTEEFGEDIALQFREGLRLGVDGWLDDDLAFVKPWGFELDEISVPVVLWQGSEDLMVPFAHGRWLAERIPGVRAHLVQGEGHLSIGVGKIDEMLDELIAAAGGRRVHDA